MAMSPFEHVPAAVVTMVVGFILPGMLAATGGDAEAAAAIALGLLADYEPQTARELSLAGESIAYSLKALRMLADAEAPGIAPEEAETALKWASTLHRASHVAQRRLADLQRMRLSASAQDSEPRRCTLRPAEQVTDTLRTEPVAPSAGAAGAGAVFASADTLADAPATQSADALPVSPVGAPLEMAEQAADAPRSLPAVTPSDLDAAQAAFATAEARLNLMKARYKGAPPPHSQAAQQVRAQERVVETARMKVKQASGRQVEVATRHRLGSIAA